jgi:hypothetical protein
MSVVEYTTYRMAFFDQCLAAQIFVMYNLKHIKIIKKE